MFAFVVLGLVCAVLSQVTGGEEDLRNDLFGCKTLTQYSITAVAFPDTQPTVS